MPHKGVLLVLSNQSSVSGFIKDLKVHNSCLEVMSAYKYRGLALSNFGVISLAWGFIIARGYQDEAIVGLGSPRHALN